MMSTTRIPPHDVAAEKSVLSSMLCDKEAAQYGMTELSAEDFYQPVHNAIFQAMVDLHSKNIAIDVVTVSNELSNKKILEQIGGVPYLAEMASGYYSSANIKHYAAIVFEKSVRRKCIKNSGELVNLAYEGEYSDLLANMENTVVTTKCQDIRSLPEILEDALDDVMRHMKNGKKFTGVTTGFDDFDLKLGGLQDTDLIILAARPSMGKTALALNIMQNISKKFVKQNKAVVFFSLEMGKKKIALRTLSSEVEIEAEKFKFGTLNSKDSHELQFFASIFEDEMGAIYVSDEMDVTTRDMFAWCYGLRGRTGKDIGLIAVDYLQLIKPVKATNSRNEDLTHISRELKRMAKEFNCPVIALSQLSRGVESRNSKRPMLSDLRESGAIEQDADVVAFLYRDEYYNPDTESKNVAEVIIAKHRDGSLGTIELLFRPEYVSFKNIDKR